MRASSISASQILGQRIRFSTLKNVLSVSLRSSALALVLLAPFARYAQAGPLFGPIMGYDSFAKSPLNGMSFTYFHLIQMTNLPSGLPMTAPGATASAGVVIGPGSLVDSVDGENAGHSLFSGDGSTGITFTFDKTVLGALPTAAGIAWTDGVRLIHFSAVDANGVSLGKINDNTCCDFSSGDGNPANYRLFYVIDSAGIKSITISNDSGGIEVDHLQYGLLASTSVPEPGSLILVGSALCAICFRLRRPRV